MRARTVIGGLFSTLAAAAVVVALPGLSSAAQNPTIVGGQDADQTYSFMASMQNASTGGHRCGASLIASQWLVTAKHCVAGQQPGNYKFRIGSTSLSDG